MNWLIDILVSGKSDENSANLVNSLFIIINKSLFLLGSSHEVSLLLIYTLPSVDDPV